MSVDQRIARAREQLGTPFRLHGRNPAFGFDCVGLVAWACDRIDDAPAGYNLRTYAVEHWIRQLDSLALRRASGEFEVGDIMFLRAGPAQLHLGLWTGASLIHADARLGKVVEVPGALSWPVIAAWTLTLDEEA